MDAAGDEIDRDLAQHHVAEEGLRDIPRSEDRLLYAHTTALLCAGYVRSERSYFFRLLAMSWSNSFVS